MLNVHCTTYTVPRTLYDVHCTTYTVRRTLYDVQCTTYTVRLTSYIIRYEMSKFAVKDIPEWWLHHNAEPLNVGFREPLKVGFREPLTV